MRPLVGTSLKMHLTPSETDAYLARLAPLLAGIDGCDLFVLPSFAAIWVARRRLAGTRVAWGAQDVHEAEGGAHTGDVSARMLVDLGCTYVEVGHAERRRDHGETDARVAAKVARAAATGLTPIVCVGEAIRLAPDAALDAARAQTRAALAGLPADGHATVVVAYEPVWAIGAGAEPAPPSHVAAMHAGLHETLRSVPGIAPAPRVIYGGSVDPGSAFELLRDVGVDGLFVGRAALDPVAFAAIAAIASDPGVRESAAGERPPA